MMSRVGSPPRVRGKVVKSSERIADAGITPACAGKSTHHNAKNGESEDHPRVCGEKKAREYGEAKKKGSPPRVRGKAGHNIPYTATGRITPACAGKSPCC